MSSAEPGSKLQLCSELSPWEITLKSGDVIVLHAHSYGKEGNVYVFDIMLEGTPVVLSEVARVPVELVDTIYSM